MRKCSHLFLIGNTMQLFYKISYESTLKCTHIGIATQTRETLINWVVRCTFGYSGFVVSSTLFLQDFNKGSHSKILCYGFCCHLTRPHSNCAFNNASLTEVEDNLYLSARNITTVTFHAVYIFTQYCLSYFSKDCGTIICRLKFSLFHTVKLIGNINSLGLQQLTPIHSNHQRCCIYLIAARQDQKPLFVVSKRETDNIYSIGPPHTWLHFFMLIDQLSGLTETLWHLPLPHMNRGHAASKLQGTGQPVLSLYYESAQTVWILRTRAGIWSYWQRYWY